MENVKLICGKKDYRTAVVLDDVHRATFSKLQVSEPGTRKESIYSRNSTDIVNKK